MLRAAFDHRSCPPESTDSIAGARRDDVPHARPRPQAAPPRIERTTLTGRDLRLLERVRQRIADAPGEPYSLQDLASLACMSQSTLRAKFHAAYDCSVFTWLRECRLALARQQLARGWTVQQAAHAVGYRHATNFATAFRRRYGVPPSRLNARAA